MKQFINFLEKLEKHKIYYKLDKIRKDYVMVEIAVPGERWEVEFSADGDIVVEIFGSIGDVAGEETLDYLFENFSD